MCYFLCVTFYSYVRQYRNLIMSRILFDLRMQYRGSVLGLMWTLIFPLLLASILYSVFKVFIPSNLSGNFDFFAYVYSGVIAVNLFNSSLFNGTQVVDSNLQVLRSIKLPLFPFHIINIINNWVNSIFATCVLLIYGSFSNLQMNWRIIFIPILLFNISIVAFLIAQWLCFLNSHFRDVSVLLPIFASILMYLTPVFYIPRNDSPRLDFLLSLNPLLPFLTGIRAILGIEHWSGEIFSGFIWLLFSFTAIILTIPLIEKQKTKMVFRH